MTVWVVAALSGDTACTRDARRTTCKHAGGGVSVVERRASELMLVVGAPADAVTPVMDEAWKRWKIGR